MNAPADDAQVSSFCAALPGLAWPEGSDAELPLLLTTLCDADEAAREAALGELMDRVLTEQGIEAAAVIVAQQLVTLIGFEATPDKDQLLLALDALGDSGSALVELAQHMLEHEQGEHADHHHDDFEIDEDEVEVARQLRAAVVQGGASMVALLDADDEDTRVCAAYALTVPLSARPREITEALVARYEQEQAPRARASLLLALGLSGQSSVVELIREALEGAETHIERVAAAMAMIPFFGHLVQDEAILTLIDALAEPDELRLVYEELPWADDDLVVDLGALLASFNDGGRCPVLAPLYERLAGCETRSGVMSLLEAAMIIAFEPHEHEGPEFEIEALSGPQRDLLARVEKEDRLWSSAIRVGELLGDYGLPADRAALRSLLRES